MGQDEAIFLIVVGLRLFVPLLIFRYPLPAIFACLVIDAADQTIFQNRTDLDLTNYQGYDKALDVYYLSMAYLSTFRNWSDPFAARTAQFLWYYRLVGVVAFELTDVRTLLLIFPNTFEYFFIAYEFVRLAWDPARLSHRQVIKLAAFIWIFIKLPQEYWIHVAQLDFTDFMKEDVFGVSTDTSWGDAISENLWFIGLLVALVVIVVLIVRWALRIAPPPDWKISADVESHRQSTRSDVTPESTQLIEWDLLEKAVFVSLVAIIFAQVIPSTDLSPFQILVTVSALVIANAAVSQFLAARGHSWTSTITLFTAMLVVNALLVLLYVALFRRDDDVNESAALFFLLLITLITALYDHYRPLRSAGYPALRTES